MTRDELLPLIGRLVNEKRANLGLAAIAVSPDDAVLDGDLEIDSLDLAAIIVELQEAVGRDPFADGFIEFRTIGELVELFAA